MATWSDTVNQITAQGITSGLTKDQIQAAIAIAQAEGGWSGNVGDNGQSFGVFQFYTGGQLPGFLTFAQQRGYSGISSTFVAGNLAITQPQLAIQYALQPGGYLYNALQAGSQAGKTGADLAYYAEEYGQRSAPQGWTNAANAWNSLFGPGGNGPSINAPIPGPSIIQSGLQGLGINLAPSISLPGTTDIATAITNLGNALGQIPTNLSAPFVNAFNDVTAVGAFLGQPNLIRRGLLLIAGGLTALVGLILFALSFVHVGNVKVG